MTNKTCSFANMFKHEPFDDDMDWSPLIGIVWQRDRTKLIPYDENYWDNYVSREHTEIARKLNKFRCEIVERHNVWSLLDIGIGCGEFLKKVRTPNATYGYDVNPTAVKWLKERGLFCNPYVNLPYINAITLWDVLEHIPDPKELLELVPCDVRLFISIPIFDDMKLLKKSKHYKPREHLTYFSKRGLMTYMTHFGYHLLETSDGETEAGRDNIKTFVFKRAYEEKTTQ